MAIATPLPPGHDVPELMQFDLLFSSTYVDVFDDTHSLNWRKTVSWDPQELPKH
jgi:hypothetical protein